MQYVLGFPILSDWDHEVILAYYVVLPDMYGMLELAHRCIFRVDDAGTANYRWVREGENPDFDDLVSEVQVAVENTVAE
jgi:peroxiredoxin